jgi:hypothetical protein
MGSIRGWANETVKLVDTFHWVRTYAPQVARRLHRDSETFVRGATITGGSGGDVSDPTGEAAVDDTPLPGMCDIDRLENLTERASRAIEAVKAEMAKALPIPEVAADDLARRTGLVCSNPVCDAIVDGTQDNRLRGDRCEPCSRYWLRYDKKRERPLNLVLRGEVGTNLGDT